MNNLKKARLQIEYERTIASY